jgi:hypothetical protein
MRSPSLLRSTLVAALAASILPPAALRAQGAEGASSDGGMSTRSSVVARTANGQVYAYSEVRVLPINMTVTRNGAVVPAAAVVNGKGIGGLLKNRTYASCSPSVTSGVVAKAAAGQIERIESESRVAAAPAGLAVGVGEFNVTGAATTRLTATAFVMGNLLACGRAEDPMVFDPGSVAFDLTFDGISLTATPGSLGSAWGAEMHSSIPTLTDLFTLAINGPPGMSSRSDLLIDFVSNPLLGMDDAAFEELLRSRFTVGGGAATLATPTSLSFTLNSTSSFSVANAVEAAAAATVVPEPSTLLLVAGGALPIAVLARRRR